MAAGRIDSGSARTTHVSTPDHHLPNGDTPESKTTCASPEVATRVESFRPQCGFPSEPARQDPQWKEEVSPIEIERQRSTREHLRRELKGALVHSLQRLAQRTPEPMGVIGPTITPGKISYGGDLRSVIFSDNARQALSVLSKQEGASVVSEAVRHLWPRLSASDASQLSGVVTEALSQRLRDRLGDEMREVAVSAMREAATQFRALANDRRSVEQLITRLEQAPAEGRKNGLEILGLNDPSPLSKLAPGDVADRLRNRAALIEQESKKLNTGAGRLALVMADHDVREVFMARAQITPNSWAATSIGDFKTFGDEKKKTIEYTRMACALGAGLFTAGLGPAGLAGIAVGSAGSMTMGAPALLKASADVKAAQAGLSSGTMGDDAVQVAKSNQRNTTIAFAAGAVAPAITATKPFVRFGETVGHSLEKITPEFAHTLGHLAVEGAAHLGIEAVEHAFHGHGERTASGQSAVDREHVKTP